MATTHNGRNEQGSYDGEPREYWSGLFDDAESRAIGKFIPIPALISQFHIQSPWDEREAAQNSEFAKRVYLVASACLRSQKPNITPSSASEKEAFSAVWQFARRIRDNNEVVGVDQVMFADGAGVAGTANLVFKCNGRTYVCDWVVGNLMAQARCKFNVPFSHLVADPMTIYSLRCSMCQVLADVGGYFNAPSFAPARLLWLHQDCGKWKVDAVSCRDLRREAATMMLSRCYTAWYRDWRASCPF